MFRYLRPKIWELGQLIFGADASKEQVLRTASGLDDYPVGERRILDFGCATGHVAEVFFDSDYTGVDIDAGLIQFANRKYHQYPNAKFLTNEEFDSELKGVQWPVVLLAATAHHLDELTLIDVLRELQTRIEPGGKLVFIEPVITGKESRLLRLLLAMDQGRYHRTLEAYRRLFEQIGFSISDVREFQIQGRIFPQPASVSLHLSFPASKSSS